jgi:hypothetical protein
MKNLYGPSGQTKMDNAPFFIFKAIKVGDAPKEVAGKIRFVIKWNHLSPSLSSAGLSYSFLDCGWFERMQQNEREEVLHQGGLPNNVTGYDTR